ncbi:MAG: phage tail tape measure protein, partial [Spirochaetae bacterium HGW-Spirochaetae-10]
VGGAMMAASLGITGAMINARMEVSRLEGNIRSLGVSATELSGINQSADILAARLGLAKERILSGVYDIKSAADGLNNLSLASFTESVALTAIATKGNFENLSRTFGMVYNQYRHLYSGMNDEQFGRNIANDIAWTANRFAADGETINQAFTSLGSSAAVARLSLEEQSAVIGRLLNTMVPESAGTSLRAFIDKLPQAAQKLGISAFDASGKMRSIPDVLDQINAKFPDLQKNGKILNEAFTEEGVKVIKNLSPFISLLRDDIAELQTASANADFSALNAAAKANLETVPATLDRIREGAHALWTSMGTGVNEAFGVILRPIANLLELLNSLPMTVKYGAGVVIGLAAAITGAAGAVIFFSSAWTAWQALGTLTGLTGHKLALDALNAAQMSGAMATIANTKAQIVNTAAIRFGTLSRTVSVGVLGLERTAVSASTVLYGVLTGKVGLATAAQWAWNAAMMANPVGLIIAGVVALTAAIGGLLYFSGAFEEMFKKKIDLRADDAIEQVRTLRQEIEQIGFNGVDVGSVEAELEKGRKGLKSNAALVFDNVELRGQIQHIEDIRNKLQSVMQTIDPTTDRYTRMSSQVDEINRRLLVMRSLKDFNTRDMAGLPADEMLKRLTAIREMRISAGLDTRDVDYWLKQLSDGVEVPVKYNLTALDLLKHPTRLFEALDDAMRNDPITQWMNGLHEKAPVLIDIPQLYDTASRRLARYSRAVVDQWDAAMKAIPGLLDEGAAAFNGWVEKVKTRAYAAGKGLITAFTQGVKEFTGLPIDAVLKVLSGIGSYLPHSDADRGPLSTLTASGRALPETLAAGIGAGAPVAITHIEQLAANLLPSVPPSIVGQFERSAGPAPIVPSLKIDIQNLIGELTVGGQEAGSGNIDELSSTLARLLRRILENQIEGLEA